MLTIVTISLSMFARTMASSKSLDPIASETAVAASAARTLLEEMKAQPFDKLFALYNANPNDDPDGAGTAPGAHFAVPELRAIPGTMVGTIIFPTIGGVLREDTVDAPLGMPRDLNASDIVETTDRAGDYVLLPVRIRLDWITKGTKDSRRNFEMFTMYARF